MEEFWHWEYHGTYAKQYMSKYPTIRRSKTITVDGDLKPFVKNPKSTKNNQDDYRFYENNSNYSELPSDGVPNLDDLTNFDVSNFNQ